MQATLLHPVAADFGLIGQAPTEADIEISAGRVQDGSTIVYFHLDIFQQELLI